MSRVSPQLIVFSYHKSGTSLLLHVMTKVCDRLGLTLSNQFGLVEGLGDQPDVVLLPHSLLRAPLDRPYRAIRMIRDPRDIWVSGYLYHRHSDEEWCINTDFDLTPPIGWPRVDHSFMHLPEAWKRGYFERLQGQSYQRNLLDRSQAEGLQFELEGYTGCTLTAMREWALNGADALDVKLEDVSADFDGSMARIFDQFGFDAEQSRVALEVARSEDVNRMDEADIASRPQIHSRVISKWRAVLSPEQVGCFEALYGDLILGLGYELSGVAPGVASEVYARGWFPSVQVPLSVGSDVVDMEAVRLVWPAPDALAGSAGESPADGALEVWLSADDATIRPTVAGPGRFGFVLPRGVRRVRLESRRASQVDPCAPYLGQSRGRGVRVSEIAIRSGAAEVVIPADDPRLVDGWYEAEQSGLALWRWTDGSAEVPWVGVSGPAVVTVRCATVGVRSGDEAFGRVVA